VINDPIVDEVRKAREEYARSFNYDLKAMFDDLQRRERESGRQTVSFPPKCRSTVRATGVEINSQT
jgi:hypothetical protein